MGGANLDDRGPALPIRPALARRGHEAEQRQVRLIEDVGALAQPLVGVAVEIIDHLDGGDRVELALGQRVAGARADKAMGQLRRQADHLRHQALESFLVERLLGERGEEDCVLAGEKEPLEIGEERLRIFLHGCEGEIERLGMIGRKARRRKTLHDNFRRIPCSE